MRVLVVGSTGTIGKHLSLSLKQNGAQVFGASRSAQFEANCSLRFDLQNISEAVEQVKQLQKLDAVVMCAAASNLRECENNPELTSRVNISSQSKLAKVLIESGIKKVVYLSSNRVFDGKSAHVSKDVKYSPKTEYGRQKAMAETELLKLGDQVRILRLTKVVSEKNELITSWVNKLKLNQPIRAFSDVMISPITLDDTVGLIEEVISGEFESTVQFSATDEISYLELGQFVAKFIGADSRLVIAQRAEDVGETALEHASLECSKFKSIVPTSSLNAIQKVLEKMI